MVELGSVYWNIYDVTITVLETVRGSQAMEHLKAAAPMGRVGSGSDRVSKDFGDGAQARIGGHGKSRSIRGGLGCFRGRPERRQTGHGI